jgi:hypothetical protein
MTCPGCKEALKFKGYRDKHVVSLLGTIRVGRGYYPCRHCGSGQFPWDQTLRLTPQGLTPGAQEIVALGGTQEAFGKAAEWTLRKMASLRLSESTVQRTTEAAGERLAQQRRDGKVFGVAESWDWHRDAAGKTCAYLSLDATGVMMQGPDGSKADGRMAYVAMIYNPQPRAVDDAELSKPCDGVRYLAGHYTLEELGTQMRQQAAQVGVGQAEQWIALSDGGNGLENWFDVNFPRAVKILDFRHASEYLADLAKSYRKGAAAQKLTGAWCHTLKHAGGATLLKVLERLKPETMSPEVRTQYDTTTNYLRKNVERMNYPEYLRQGWQIASGGIESACKTVVNQRLCLGGMRWAEANSDAVCHLRALYRSDPDQWDSFWEPPLAA